MSPIECKVFIIGAGPAGYTAAIYSARANLSPVLVEGLQPGGQLTITTEIENYSGFAEAVQGPWLMEQMKSQALNVGARLVSDIVSEVDFKTRPFLCRTDSNVLYSAQSVIVATGAQAKWLGLPGEALFNGRGVSACATCDGFFYREKNIVVVGGGNTAVEEALYLSNIARRVTLIHRRNELRAEQILQDRLVARSNVNILWNTEVVDILGTDGSSPKLTALAVRDTTSGKMHHIEVDGLFVAIGHSPNTDLFKGQLDLDEAGYIVADPGSSRTSIPGIFAAGDVRDSVYRQAITAAGLGCMAALDAERYLSSTLMRQRAG